MYPNQQYAPQQPMMTLPYHPQALQHPYLQLDQNTPPVVPPCTAPSQIHPFVPLISAVAAIEIQNNALANPLRTVMFNQYARDRFQNPNFFELVDMAANYVHILLSSGRAQYNSPQQAVVQVTPEIVRMLACGVKREFPAIVQYLDQATAASADQGAQALSSIVQEIERSQRTRMAPQAMGFPPQGAQFGMPPQQQYFGQQQLNTGYGMGAGNRNAGGALSANAAPMFGNTPVRTAQPEQQVQPQQPLQGMSRYQRQLLEQNGINPDQVAQPEPAKHLTMQHRTVADLLQPTNDQLVQQPFRSRDPAVVSEFSSQPVQQGAAVYAPNPSFQQAAEQLSAPAQQAAPQVALNNGEPVRICTPKELEEMRLKWTPSKLQPYHPAWHARSQQLLYAVEPNPTGGRATVIAVIQDKPEGANMMDYDKHGIGVAPKVVAPAPTDNPDAVVKDLVQELPLDITIEGNKDSYAFETTLASAFCQANAVVAVGGKVSDISKAYRQRFLLAEEILCDSEEQAAKYRRILTDLHDSGSFARAREILLDLTAPDELLLRNRVNAYLTEEVQSKLHLELSTAVSLGDFVEDSGDLDAFLRKQYSDATAEALKVKEGTILANAIDLITSAEDAKQYSTANTSDMEGADTWKGDVAYIESMISITHVGLASHELNLAMKPGYPALITDANTPAFNNFVVKLLTSPDVRESRFRKHIVVTKDSVRLEVARGYLNKDAYVMRVIR